MVQRDVSAWWAVLCLPCQVSFITMMMLASIMMLSASCPKGGSWSACREHNSSSSSSSLVSCAPASGSNPPCSCVSALLGRVKVMLEEGSSFLLCRDHVCCCDCGYPPLELSAADLLPAMNGRDLLVDPSSSAQNTRAGQPQWVDCWGRCALPTSQAR